jgi:hypothetical protein
MPAKIARGALSGLLAGVAFGFLLERMTVVGADGERIPAILLVSHLLGSTHAAVGWAVHLFNSAAVGALFGALPGRFVENVLGGLLWGALYGVAWWILSSFVLLPLGMDALGSLAGHLVYGLILGTCYDALRPHPIPEEPAPVGRRRPATQAHIGSE